jgi:hypothetical protein
MIGLSTVGVLASSGGGVAYDSDAQAFFTANSTLTDVTQKNAINQFVLDLKSNSLWTLGKYLYLGFLGDSTKVKYNLFAPASNVLTLSSGWTYDSQGMQGNGTSAYAQTGFILPFNNNVNNKSLFIYSQTNINSLSCDLGSQGDYGLRDHLFPRYNNLFYGTLSYNGSYSTSNTDSTGLFVTSRTSSTTTKMYRNNTLLSTNTSLGDNNSTKQDFLGAMNENGTANYFSNRKISIYGRMEGLDVTQEANLNTCINTLLTTLSIPTW